jgi:hypothetical protein
VTTIHDILSELNLENGSNYKLAVLKKHKDNELLKRVLKMTYDTVEFSYGVTPKQIEKFAPEEIEIPINLEYALAAIIYSLCSRERTGHAALQLASNLIGALPEDDGELLKKIFNRDLRINLGKTQINKVWKDLITKPVYMRCGTYNEKTIKKIVFPAIVQLKADGTYREFTVHNGHVTSRSRSGESYDYPVIFEQMKDFRDGVYVGELTISGIDDRAKGNGLINSDNPPHDDIILELWDYITPDEYSNAGAKVKNTIDYSSRFEFVKKLPESKNIKTIPHLLVNNISEALKYTHQVMEMGYEGSILKNLSAVFRDGTSPDQLKLKLQIDCEMRIVGFQDGRTGTKREGKIGSIVFENDEGTIKGRCSGFSDQQLDEFTEKQDELIGKIITVQFNDLSKADGHEYHALSHPRFIEIRNDKDETDTLEKVFQLRDMATSL